MSKARTVANMSITPMAVSDQLNTSTGYFDTPSGTTAQRPASPSNGMIRYNSDLAAMEVYAGGAWGTIAPPPSIQSVSPTTYNGEQGTTFTLTGSNFTSDAVVKFITSGGVEYTAAVVTRVSSTQLTATTPQDFTVAQEPLSVKISQGSGSVTLSAAIDCGGSPVWTTASGSLASIYDNSGSQTVATVVATDPDAGATISYSVTSGSLPSGFSLNSSTGVISGTPTTVSGNVTSSFTITATDNAGNATARAFSITVNQSTEPGAGAGLVAALSTTTNGTQLTNNSMTMYWDHCTDASPNSPGTLYDFTNYGANSTYFKIHSGHSGYSPNIHVVQISSTTPRVLNQFRWIKHGNSCGNVDFYGSNKAITSGNFTDITNNWTFIGRGYMGGGGSATDGTVMTVSGLNPNNYGFKWYAIVVRDNGSSLSYPSIGTMGGYAMYGASWDKV